MGSVVRRNYTRCRWRVCVFGGPWIAGQVKMASRAAADERGVDDVADASRRSRVDERSMLVETVSTLEPDTVNRTSTPTRLARVASLE